MTWVHKFICSAILAKHATSTTPEWAGINSWNLSLSASYEPLVSQLQFSDKRHRTPSVSVLLYHQVILVTFSCCYMRLWLWWWLWPQCPYNVVMTSFNGLQVPLLTIGIKMLQDIKRIPIELNPLCYGSAFLFPPIQPVEKDTVIREKGKDEWALVYYFGATGVGTLPDGSPIKWHSTQVQHTNLVLTVKAAWKCHDGLVSEHTWSFLNQFCSGTTEPNTLLSEPMHLDHRTTASHQTWQNNTFTVPLQEDIRPYWN